MPSFDFAGVRKAHAVPIVKIDRDLILRAQVDLGSRLYESAYGVGIIVSRAGQHVGKNVVRIFRILSSDIALLGSRRVSVGLDGFRGLLGSRQRSKKELEVVKVREHLETGAPLIPEQISLKFHGLRLHSKHNVMKRNAGERERSRHPSVPCLFNQK